MPKYVVSSTLSDPEWNNTTVIAPGEIAEAVGRLRDEVDGDVLVNGSVQLVDALHEHGLVDEYRLMVFPTVLGSGKRLFAAKAARPATMKLAESRQVGDEGVFIAHLRARGLMDRLGPDSEMARLEPLIGEWTVESSLAADPAPGPAAGRASSGSAIAPFWFSAPRSTSPRRPTA